jgi:carbamoyl-phosphate synthase large subunit
MRILVTCAGGTLVPLSIQQLRAARGGGNFILGVDMRADVPARHFADTFETVPAAESPDYLPAIMGLVRRHGIELVVPWSDGEALELARHREDLAALGCKLACADMAALRVMENKASFYDFLSRSGIRSPWFRAVSDAAGLRAALDELIALRGVAVVKPAVSRGGRDVFILYGDDRERVALEGRELHIHISEFETHTDAVLDKAPLIVMEQLYQPAYDLDIVSFQGVATSVIPRLRINPSGIPPRGNHIVPDPALIEMGRRVAESMRLSWIYDCDVMKNSDGEFCALEMNPRPSGSLAVSIAAGYPVFDDLLDIADGRQPVRRDVATACTVATYLTAEIV